MNTKQPHKPKTVSFFFNHGNKSDNLFQERLNWVDYAKGIAIFLVVVSHVLRGLINSDILTKDPVLSLIDEWMYAFHMPLFFFLSGLFAVRAVSKSWKIFINIKLKTLVYPYFLWSTIQISLESIMSSYTNTPSFLSEMLIIPLNPPSQFWFIYTLFFLFIIYAVVFRLKINAVGLLFLALFFYFTNYYADLGPWRAPNLIRNSLLYFAFGITASELGITSWLSQLRSQLLVSGFVLGYMLLFLFLLYCDNNTSISRLICASLGGSGTVFLSIFFARFNLANFIAHWGRLSLQIYLAHIIFGSGMRIILDRFLGFHIATVHITLGILTAIYGPIILDWTSKKIGVNYLFSLR